MRGEECSRSRFEHLPTFSRLRLQLVWIYCVLLYAWQSGNRSGSVSRFFFRCGKLSKIKTMEGVTCDVSRQETNPLHERIKIRPGLWQLWSGLVRWPLSGCRRCLVLNVFSQPKIHFTAHDPPTTTTTLLGCLFGLRRRFGLSTRSGSSDLVYSSCGRLKHKNRKIWVEPQFLFSTDLAAYVADFLFAVSYSRGLAGYVACILAKCTACPVDVAAVTRPRVYNEGSCRM